MSDTQQPATPVEARAREERASDSPSKTLLVRIRAYDPRRGHILRRFSFRSLKFSEDRGWYRVPIEVAEYLRGVRQVAADPHSPLAFDVHTEAEAREIDARDAAERVSRASPVDAAAIVTSDDARRASRSGRR